VNGDHRQPVWREAGIVVQAGARRPLQRRSAESRTEARAIVVRGDSLPAIDGSLERLLNKDKLSVDAT
jgi:hypothetical protein